MSQPNRRPAVVRRTTLTPSMILKESVPVFWEIKRAMKSVPPVLALDRRQRLTTTPLMMPPKMLIRSRSDVMACDGMISVRKPDRRIR